MEQKRTAAGVSSDLEFVQELRSSVARYLQAIDHWEAEYQKYYRLARPHETVSPDLEEAQSAYVSSRRELETLIPRARRLCAKFEFRDVWPGLVRIELGGYSPQARMASAFGRSERLAIADCLANLELRCGDDEIAPGQARDGTPNEKPRRNFIQRIVDYFF